MGQFIKWCVGAHLRHVIEHYQRFLIGTRDGEVNYDARQRDMRIATDRNLACSVNGAGGRGSCGPW